MTSPRTPKRQHYHKRTASYNHDPFTPITECEDELSGQTTGTETTENPDIDPFSPSKQLPNSPMLSARKVSTEDSLTLLLSPKKARHKDALDIRFSNVKQWIDTAELDPVRDSLLQKWKVELYNSDYADEMLNVFEELEKVHVETLMAARVNEARIVEQLVTFQEEHADFSRTPASALLDEVRNHISLESNSLLITLARSVTALNMDVGFGCKSAQPFADIDFRRGSMIASMSSQSATIFQLETRLAEFSALRQTVQQQVDELISQERHDIHNYSGMHHDERDQLQIEIAKYTKDTRRLDIVHNEQNEKITALEALISSMPTR